MDRQVMVEKRGGACRLTGGEVGQCALEGQGRQLRVEHCGPLEIEKRRVEIPVLAPRDRALDQQGCRMLGTDDECGQSLETSVERSVTGRTTRPCRADNQEQEKGRERMGHAMPMVPP